jgi:gas vesicle protein
MESKALAGFGVGLVTGVLIGGVFALLYAPKTGKQTRQLIRDAASEVVDSVKNEANNVKDLANETASEAGRVGHAVAKVLKS